MALIKCPKCGNKVSSKAEQCPKCGYSVKKIIAQRALKTFSKVFLAVCIAIGIGAGVVNLYYYIDTDRVPDYVGQEYDEVIQNDEVSKYKINYTGSYSKIIPEGVIISQKNKYDGRKIKEINFTVSVGDNSIEVTMPKVTDMDIQQAVDKLYSLQIYNIKIERINASYGCSQNEVFSQKVHSGEKIQNTKEVILRVQGFRGCIIPYIIGEDIEQGLNELKDFGMKSVLYDENVNTDEIIYDVQDEDGNSIVGKVIKKEDTVYLKTKK